MPDLPKLRAAPADKDGGTSRHRDIAAALPRIVPPKGGGRGVSLRPAGSELLPTRRRLSRRVRRPPRGEIGDEPRGDLNIGRADRPEDHPDRRPTLDIQ